MDQFIQPYTKNLKHISFSSFPQKPQNFFFYCRLRRFHCSAPAFLRFALSSPRSRSTAFHLAVLSPPWATASRIHSFKWCESANHRSSTINLRYWISTSFNLAVRFAQPSRRFVCHFFYFYQGDLVFFFFSFFSNLNLDLLADDVEYVVWVSKVWLLFCNCFCNFHL